MSLKDITLNYLIKNLSADCLEEIAKKYIVPDLFFPWVRYIGRVFDEVPQKYRDDIINDFRIHFPQFVFKSTRNFNGLTGTKLYNSSIYHFTRDQDYFYISTIDIKDVNINRELMLWIQKNACKYCCVDVCTEFGPQRV